MQEVCCLLCRHMLTQPPRRLLVVLATGRKSSTPTDSTPGHTVLHEGGNRRKTGAEYASTLNSLLPIRLDYRHQ